MDEKTPHSRTVSLSLCGIIIFKTKADTKPIKAMKPSNKVKNAFSKLGIPGKGSKASPEQDESGPSHLTSSAPEDPCADSPKQFKVEAVLHKYVVSESYFPMTNIAQLGKQLYYCWFIVVPFSTK